MGSMVRRNVDREVNALLARPPSEHTVEEIAGNHTPNIQAVVPGLVAIIGQVTTNGFTNIVHTIPPRHSTRNGVPVGVVALVSQDM